MDFSFQYNPALKRNAQPVTGVANALPHVSASCINHASMWLNEGMSQKLSPIKLLTLLCWRYYYRLLKIDLKDWEHQ